MAWLVISMMMCFFVFVLCAIKHEEIMKKDLKDKWLPVLQTGAGIYLGSAALLCAMLVIMDMMS